MSSHLGVLVGHVGEVCITIHDMVAKCCSEYSTAGISEEDRDATVLTASSAIELLLELCHLCEEEHAIVIRTVIWPHAWNILGCIDWTAPYAIELFPSVQSFLMDTLESFAPAEVPAGIWTVFGAIIQVQDIVRGNDHDTCVSVA